MNTTPGDVGFAREALREAQVTVENSENTEDESKAAMWALQSQTYALIAIGETLNDLLEMYYEVHR